MKKRIFIIAIISISIMFCLSAIERDSKSFNIKFFKHGSSNIELKPSNIQPGSNIVTFSASNGEGKNETKKAEFDLSWELYKETLDDVSCSIKVYFVTSEDDYDNGYMLYGPEGLNYSVKATSKSIVEEISVEKNKSNERMELVSRTMSLVENQPLDVLYPFRETVHFDMTLTVPYGEIIVDGEITEKQDYRFLTGSYTGYIFVEVKTS